MGVILKNNATSTITTAISASDVGLAVATGTGSLFPTLGAGDYFYATLVSSGGTYEVIKVTARVGDTMTIVRAQEGTTAQSFASGSRIEVRVTAASITDMVNEHDQASEISFAPTGSVSATDVQAAIAELDTEKTTLAAVLARLDDNDGSSLVGHIATGTGATARTVQAKLRDTVSVEDYGAVGDGVTDDTAAIQAAVNASSLVFISAGKIFRVTAKVTVPSDVTIYGAGTILIDQSPYIGGIALGDNCTVEGVTFYGNGTQTAFGAISGGQRGAAILGYDVSNIRVLNCKFYDFLGNGLNVAAGIVQFGYSNNCRISGCYFDNSNYGFSDIDASYLAGDCIYDANISYSNSDIFIGIASVGTATNIAGTEVSVAAHHIISNNIHIKNRWATPPVGQVLGRHGIASHYDGGRDYMTMTGNIIGHVSRHGVYLRGPDASMSVVTGPDTITGNYFLYCGNASGDVSNYYSGIRAENTIPTIIQGNYFYKSGYFPDGSAGVGPAYDIECVRGTNDITVTNNMLFDSLSGSIVLSQSVTNRTINRVNIANNNIRNSAIGIVLDASGAGSVINDCKIIGNFITLTGATFGGNRAAGVAVEFGSGTSSFAYSWLISSNTIVGTGKTNNQYGVTVQLSGSDFTKKCTVQDNSFRSLEEGFASRRFLAGSVDYPAHRTLGVFTRVAGNKFVSCGAGVYIEKNNGNDLAFIEPTNQFDDCTSTGIIQTIDNGGVVVGVVSGFDASGNALVEIQSDTTPAFLSYYRGEKVIDLTPSASGFIGSVCTASGSPGTWKTFGAVSA